MTNDVLVAELDQPEISGCFAVQTLTKVNDSPAIKPRNKGGRPKGYPKSGGRAKGQPTKTTADIREMVCKALNMVGGEKYFARQAEKNPAAFMSLVGKVMPLQVQASGGGAMLLEQLALAAQALRERAQIPPPAPDDRVIEHGPVYKDSDDSPADSGARRANGPVIENKHKQDQ